MHKFAQCVAYDFGLIFATIGSSSRDDEIGICMSRVGGLDVMSVVSFESEVFGGSTLLKTRYVMFRWDWNFGRKSNWICVGF